MHSLVFNNAKKIVSEASVSQKQIELLHDFIDKLYLRTSDSEFLPYIDLPLIINKAIGSDINTTSNICLSTLFMFLAADIADDIADGDFQEKWNYKSINPGLIASILFSSSFSYIAVDNCNLKSDIKNSLKFDISKAIVSMSAGQQDDIDISKRLLSISVDDILNIVSGKSGREFACFAKMCGVLNNSDISIINKCDLIGLNLGISMQLQSDCYELMAPNEGRDFVNLTPTLPLVIHANRLNEEEKKLFFEEWIQAKTNHLKRKEIRNKVIESGALFSTYKIINSHKRKALNDLEIISVNNDLFLDSRTIINQVINVSC